MGVIGAARSRRPVPRDWKPPSADLPVCKAEGQPGEQALFAACEYLGPKQARATGVPFGRSLLGDEAARVLQDVSAFLSPQEMDELKPFLAVHDPAALFPCSSAGSWPTRTLVVPQQDSQGQSLARYLGETSDCYIVEYGKDTLAFDRKALDAIHDYRPFLAPFVFEDVRVDPAGDTRLIACVDQVVAAVDRSAAEVDQVAQAIQGIRQRMRYDFDNAFVEPPPTVQNDEEMGLTNARSLPVRPMGEFIEHQLGVCRHFAVLLKLVLDRLGIESRIERGQASSGMSGMGDALFHKLRTLPPLLRGELGDVVAALAKESRSGYHVWVEVRLRDLSTWAADASADTLSPTVRAYATRRLQPSFSHPWFEFVKTL